MVTLSSSLLLVNAIIHKIKIIYAKKNKTLKKCATEELLHYLAQRLGRKRDIKIRHIK